jgi:predicted nucleic acid-binding protein
VQVLGEFFHVAVIRKALLTAAEAEIVLAELSALPVELVDLPVVHSAVALHKHFGTTYWDSLILATAKRAGCATVLSEDFNSGQRYDGVCARNPFIT